jgi:hypothetical protein
MTMAMTTEEMTTEAMTRTKMKMKTRTRMKNEQILTRMGTLIHCQNSKPQISMRFPAMRVT